MKKILSLLLSITLLLGCFSVVSASSQAVAVTDTEEALALLTYMDMIEGNEDLSANITRAEFASLVARAIKAQASSGKQYYVDVDSAFSLFDEVTALTELGYLSVGADKTFRPGDNIMLSEASKIVVSMIGYGELALAKGGFPSGYLQVANTLDIIQGISSQYITREQAYVMLMRAMNAPLFVASAVSNGGVSYETDKNSTILSQYHDIYYIEDTVNAAGAISLVDSAKLSEGEALIGSKTFTTEAISADMYDYLGMSIVGYYTEPEGKEASLVVALPLGEENSVITVNRANVSTLDDKGGYNFEYYDENGKVKTVSVPKGAIVIKNGAVVESKIFDEIRIAKGSYKFLDHNDDDKIDVLVVSEYYNLIVGIIENKEDTDYITVDASNELEYYVAPIGSRRKIYDKFEPAKNVDLTEESGRIVKIKNSDGSLGSMTDIAASDVISVYRSKDGSYVEVVRGQGAVNGSVTEMSYPDNNKVSLTINDTEYDMEREAFDNLDDKIKIGSTGVFYLDAFGEIGYYVNNDVNLLFGYLVAVNDSSKGLTNELQLQIYGQNKGLDIYTWSKNTEIDGTYIDSLKEAAEFFKFHTKQLIRFTANDNMVLTYVDTYKRYKDGVLTEQDDGFPDNDGEVSLIETLEFGNYRHATAYGGSFSMTLVNNTKVPVMVVPTDASVDSGDYDGDCFEMKTKAKFAVDTSYDVASYRTRVEGGFEEMILQKADAAPSITSMLPAMIIDIKTVINGDGEVVDRVALQNAKKPKYYYTADKKTLDGYNLKKGDLVWFEFNKENEIVAVLDILVDSETLEVNEKNLNNEPGYYSMRQRSLAKLTEAEATAGYTELSDAHKGYLFVKDTGDPIRFVVDYGYVAYRVDQVMRFASSKENCENAKYKYARSLGSSSLAIIAYDRNSGKDGTVYWTSYDDVIDWKSDPDNCSFIVLVTQASGLKLVYVYK